ncbi:hypothetical protein [Haloferax sp. YSSS75]|uniref:hypothetical protein n=1 Tax=Haloferax sp. YSSS75 TaxID=3388564 RepID=UPI00398D23BA
MVTPQELRKGLTSLPGFVNKYGYSGGSRRWFGIVYHRATGTITGRSIFEEEWDVCIILDACRADELQRQSDDYTWMQQVGRFPSLASCTWNWLPRTIERTPPHVLDGTTYVSANPFSGEFCDSDTFGDVDEVWRYAWDNQWGTVLPRPVTDRAIHHGRESNYDRLLVHYVQPHVPFLTEGAEALDRSNFDFDTKSNPDAWDRVTSGELARQVAIGRYRKTLQVVLEEVDILLRNIDAERVVVTADHGEAFGEWGIYGHPNGIDLPCLTEVPWVETTATDEGTHTPADYDTQLEEISRESQLRALGYTD